MAPVRGAATIQKGRTHGVSLFLSLAHSDILFYVIYLTKSPDHAFSPAKASISQGKNAHLARQKGLFYKSFRKELIIK